MAMRHEYEYAGLGNADLTPSVLVAAGSGAEEDSWSG